MSPEPPGILTRSMVDSPAGMEGSSIVVSSWAARPVAAYPVTRRTHSSALPVFFKLPLLITAPFLAPHRALLQGTENVLYLFPVHLAGSLVRSPVLAPVPVLVLFLAGLVVPFL